MDYKIVLAILAIVIGYIGYAPYIRDVFRRNTKPHTFSWIIWGILEVIGFAAQLSKGGGAGAWVTGASALTVLFVATLALTRYGAEIKPIDWLAFGGGILGIILWIITKNPLTAVILVALSDAAGFIPTFRKSYSQPYQETLFEYVCTVIKYTLALFALQALNLTTWLYPASLILTNGSFVVMAVIRRKATKNT